MRNLFSSLLLFTFRHWGKVLLTLAMIAGGVAFEKIPLVREKAHIAWHMAMSWSGIE